jgi:hypothetical protein
VSVGEKTLAAVVILFGFSTALCIVAFLVSDWRDRRKVADMVDDGLDVYPPDADGDVLAPTVVAGSDLEWQVSLDRMQRELDALLADGGERAS